MIKHMLSVYATFIYWSLVKRLEIKKTIDEYKSY
jgi:hypothetical protein